ncbi:MAG TPA: hypothetical protein VGI45_18310 [Terracidiphilus sp.]|jgi:hypothetical protein
MKTWDVIQTSIVATIWLSWIGVPIARVPTLLLGSVLAPRIRPWQRILAGLAGGIAGEFCAVCSLFLSLSMWCSHQPQPCNDAQGDVAFIYLLPIGACCGSVLALFWTWLTLKISDDTAWASVFIYSGPSRIRNLCCVFVVPLAFYFAVIWFLSNLMA